jgi:cytochrome b
VLCVSKHVWHQKQFTRALTAINEEFKKYPGLCVVEFKHRRLSHLPAGVILVWSMLILNLAYVVLIWRMRSA